MRLLTINIIVSNEEEFLLRFDDDIKSILLAYDVELHISGITNEDFIKEHQFIQFIDVDNISEYKKYKALLIKANSKYCVFFNEHILITKKLLKEMTSYLRKSKKKVITTHIKSYHLDTLDKKVFDKKINKKQKYANFLTNVKNPLYFYRYIFDTKYLNDILFESDWEKYFFKEKIILSFLQNFNEIKLLEKAVVFTDEPLENNINLYHNQFDRNWYLSYFSDFLIPYLTMHKTTPQVQKMILYTIQLRIYFNLNGRDKFILNHGDAIQFFKLIKEVLKYIDDSIIIESSNRKNLPKVFAFLFMKVKHDNKLLLEYKEQNEESLYFVNNVFLTKDCIVTGINAINYEDNELIIDCELMGDYFLENPEKQLYVQLGNLKLQPRKTDVYNIMKVFGISINRFYTFQLVIPNDQFAHGDELSFIVEIDDKKVITPISFKKTSARLIHSKASYYCFGNYMIEPLKKRLKINRKRAIKVFSKEVLMVFKSLKMRGNLKNGIVGSSMRIYYWLTKYKYSHNDIWIFFDKLYKGGDNAEYLFAYCMKHAVDKSCYYVINENAIDYNRLKEAYGDHIVGYNTLRHKMLVLNAKIIFATHASVLAFCGFGKSLQLCFRNLLNAKVVCIQHGLTIQSIAQYQNRLQDNTSMYFCASKYEIINLEHPVYGYNEKQLYLTGSPRYDGLINNDQRQILIAPTWRRNIVITGNSVGSSKSYNPNFKNTMYFKIYNNFINDKRLLNAAKKYKYKLIFLIHPTLSSQVDDYDKNDFLSIIPAISDISYEKMLTESSLMVTDYSGIQFDFAYMKKPIIYYHPDELPPQYQEGIYEYDTMGFGEIIHGYDDTIEKLCAYMKNECQMDIQYQKRVDDFFAYTDHSNCERIYNIVRD